MSFTKQEYFCVAPWMSIYINPDGRVAPCCISRADLGNINDHDIGSIMQGPEATKMRQRMLDNEPEPTCQSCWRQKYPYRLQASLNSKFIDHPQDPGLQEEFFSDPYNFRPRYLDLRWNNTCNFACIYCGPDLSSLWAEYARNDDGSAILIQKNTRITKQQLLDWTDANLKGVIQLQLAGGEPLMIKENVILLEQIKKINPEVDLLINTNLSQFENNPVFEILKTLPNVRWLVSGESVGDVFEYIRWPGNWQTFQTNLQILKTLKPRGHKILFNVVGMNLNCFSIWDYIDYVLEHDLPDTIDDIRLPLQHHRDSHHAYALARLPMEFKDRVNERVSKGRYAMPELKNYLEHLNAPPPETLGGWGGLESTVRALEKFDSARKIKSREVFKDIYRYVDNNPK